MLTITELCERLADAYESKGVQVRDNLQAGLSQEDILRIAAPLKIALPDEVIELYSWRNGHIDEFDPDLFRNIRFRDNTFISLQRAVEEYSIIQSSYGVGSTLQQDRVDLTSCLPISAFEGSWDVVACGAHLFGAKFDFPVMRVFQGIEMWFNSIPAMLQTCISWVSSPNWQNLDGLPEDDEMRIWKQHNPGIFKRAG